MSSKPSYPPVSEADAAHPCAACPLQTALNQRTPRRGVLFGLAALGAALCGLPRRVLAKKLGIPIAKVPKLQKVGGWVILKIKGQEILFVRDSASSVRAVTAICSHKKSRLAYDTKKRKVVCPNHGSAFTFEGRVLNGPAKKNLARVYWTRLDRRRGVVLIKM